MTYNKPEVVKLDSAFGAIQGTSMIKGEVAADVPARGPGENSTPAAYESDE